MSTGGVTTAFDTIAKTNILEAGDSEWNSAPDLNEARSYHACGIAVSGQTAYAIVAGGSESVVGDSIETVEYINVETLDAWTTG